MERIARPRRAGRGARAALTLLAALAATSLHAIELRVLSAGAVEPGVRPALAAFERESGHRVRIDFAAAPALRAALRATPVADVVVVPQGVVAELAATGVAVAATRAPIGRVGVGIAVRPGAAAPDVASAEALRAALVAADAVVYNRASTGLYVETMLQRLGVADVVRAKSERLADGASVMKRLLAGTAPREIGFGAMTEIALFADQGLRLLAPLPPTLQNFTTYVALPWPGATPEPARADAVAALMRALQAAPARSMFARAGIEPAP